LLNNGQIKNISCDILYSFGILNTTFMSVSACQLRYVVHITCMETGNAMHIEFWLTDCMERNHSEGPICKRRES